MDFLAFRSSILATSKELNSCIGVLLSGCALLYYLLDAHLFLQSQPTLTVLKVMKIPFSFKCGEFD